MTKPESGGSRITRQGKKLVWVTLTPAEHESVRVAAAIAGVPMSKFCMEASLRAAEKILKKSGRSP
jgi:uncharacterized protein (DUF1778 family)